MGLSEQESADRDARALELRRAGVSVRRVADQLGFEDAGDVEEAVARAMQAAGTVADPVALRAMEMDRLDRLQQGVWAKAVKGDTAAIDRVLRMAEMRLKLAGVPANARQMEDALDATVSALDLSEADAAAVAAARRVAQQVDAATATGDGLAITKALYLLPHLMNVLQELGATPAARDDLRKKAPSAKSAKLTALRGGRASG